MHIYSSQWVIKWCWMPKKLQEKNDQGDSLYVENVNGDDNQFTVFGVGVAAYVNLLEKSCSCREYDLMKTHCAHAIAASR